LNRWDDQQSLPTIYYAVKGEMRNMAKTKYGKYILTKTRVKNSNLETSAMTPVALEGLEDWGGIKHRMKWIFISKPILMVDEPHSHDFDEFLCFLGCNPANELDFEAEVELSLGKEREKQIINTPTIVCIPKGLIHCPINFKTIGKPVLFCHIYIAPVYVRKQVSG
jgi:hypothetical protein